MLEWTFDALIEHIPELTEKIDAQLEALGCPIKARTQIDVAVDELFGNIANYAYRHGTGKVTVRFGYDAGRRVVSISFIDSGVPYNPLEKEDPDVTLSAEKRKIGGLGIFLVKKTMDALRYRYSGGRNMVTIEKAI